jgi:transcriptional regulator with XRE-family HTH domain
VSAPQAPRKTSSQAKKEVGQRLRNSRQGAGLTLRELARLITEDYGYQVSFAHLARLESGGRSVNRDLLTAWAAVTGQADPQSWAEELVRVLGEERLGRPGRVLSMQFRPPRSAAVPEVLKDEELPSLLRSPEFVYARVERLLGEGAVASGGPGDEDSKAPVIVTTRGPLAHAFREAQQSIAPGALIPDAEGKRPLVQLTVASLPEQRLQVVEQMLAASAWAPRRGLYEPLVTRSESEFDIIVVPAVGGALVLSLPGGGWLWLPIAADDCPHLLEYLEPTLQEARESRVIELVRFGTPMTRYWFGEWEPPLLKYEKDAEERLFLQPHLGLLTLPVELATEKGRQEASRYGATEGEIKIWLQQRAERIAIFQRKLRSRGCTYRDIAAYEALDHMAQNGHTYIRGLKPASDPNPAARIQRFRQAYAHLIHLRDLLTSEDGISYELRFVPEEKIPSNRQWSLVRDRHSRGDVVLTFTLGGHSKPRCKPLFSDDQTSSFANAIVCDAEVSRCFRDEFDQLWSEAPDRESTIQFLQEKIDQIGAITGG